MNYQWSKDVYYGVIEWLFHLRFNMCYLKNYIMSIVVYRKQSYMWWPNMDNCIKGMVSGCLICQSVRNNPPAAPLHPWPWVTRIWQRVHIDFAEKGIRIINCG